MDHSRTPVSSSPSSIRRRPGLAFFALAMVGAGVGFKYMTTKIRNNELAQKNSSNGTFYVTVDRSGGGI
ncbi:hypothetical protein B0T17DRAFT_613925 [Bombardia bombarda]|uniref:Uncharacterized protein n=1 Tax=Bombardia bombarda TaxID=252184 RepID=A0AA39XNK4_9PEZI|nr:hypothetical protein B0T17DRAFT_613925 [Bombardia bombarda]